MDFEAYRLLQYSTSDGKHFGSQSSSLNFASAHYKGDVYRKIAIIHFNELFSDVLEIIMQRSPLGLLVILPQSIDKKDHAPRLKIWEDI